MNGIRDRVAAEVAKVAVGQDTTVDRIVSALLVGGHVLLEGVPGVAKTLVANAVARAFDLDFRRVQFTPDMLPSDLLGTMTLHGGELAFRPGPVFTNVLLADEVNRTPPKTQAALLQAMQERAVTIDGTTHPLSPGFMVLATQNPIEQEGTYPLPEAQLDRFLFKVSVGYPAREEERAMVQVHGHRTATPPLSVFGIAPVSSLDEVVAMRAAVARIRLSDEVVDYVVDLVRATRARPQLLCGASPRAANMLATAARALAATQGRGFVIPDDVKALAEPTLAHRLIISPAARMRGVSGRDVIADLLERLMVPGARPRETPRGEIRVQPR
jgi:MoxR-like ATPase